MENERKQDINDLIWKLKSLEKSIETTESEERRRGLVNEFIGRVHDYIRDCNRENCMGYNPEEGTVSDSYLNMDSCCGLTLIDASYDIDGLKDSVDGELTIQAIIDAGDRLGDYSEGSIDIITEDFHLMGTGSLYDFLTELSEPPKDKELEALFREKMEKEREEEEELENRE